MLIVFKSLLEEYRTHKMARFAVWVLAYGAALLAVDWFAGGVPRLLWFIFWLAFLTAIIYYISRLVGLFKHRVLWRLRRRLIVTYLFIAVVPILLIVLLVGLGAFIINGQFGAFLVTLRLRDRFDELKQLNRVVVHETHQARQTTPEALAARLQTFYVTELGDHAASYPGLEITIRVGSLWRAFRLDGTVLPKPVTVPVWLNREEFAGFVVDEDKLALRAMARSQTSTVGELTVILSQPFTPQLLDQVGEGIGPVGVIPNPKGEVAEHLPGPNPGSGAATPEEHAALKWSIRSQFVQLPEPDGPLDIAVFGASTLDPIVWGEETEHQLTEPVFVYAHSRIMALNRQLFVTLGRFSRIYVNTFVVVAVVFLLIESIALLIGIRLTRTMTATVDKLYDATERVKAGDFSYRIGLPAGDQLSALGEAFDGMTASVERLLQESQEKLRLESEIEIAREVQRQLFPQAVPQVPGLQLYGVCKPARGVSGDYYDFLRLGGNRVGLVLGDVSGKGISAALLMATIQSALHAQLHDGYYPGGSPEAIQLSTSKVVERLNRQLFENTPLEKYATFFFAVYDGETRKLTYTNAGHLPPVLFRRGTIERLKIGGTAMGLFSVMTYEQAEIQLEPEDLLLAFTDGITEPENSYGEEFGEGRLLEVARRALGSPPEVLVEEICRSVADWTGSPELQDDMTLLVAKTVS